MAAEEVDRVCYLGPGVPVPIRRGVKHPLCDAPTTSQWSLERHVPSLHRALSVYRGFFNGHRPHQGVGNQIPDEQATGEEPQDQAGRAPEGELTVECEQFLGGLPNSYYRKAA